MSRAEKDMLKADAIGDQIYAEIRDGVMSDMTAWGELSRKVNHAADTREKCNSTFWTEEEMYRVVRLAHLASHIVTGRLLGRKV